MFERYTEKARRVIFFARYEASRYGSPCIETEHLLLGLLREDASLRWRLLPNAGSGEAIRKEVESRINRGERIPTAVEMPISSDCKQALHYAAEEAERFEHKHIGTEHLVLGLLRVENSMASTILVSHQVTLEGFRQFLASEVRRKSVAARPEAVVAQRSAADAATMLLSFLEALRAGLKDESQEFFAENAQYIDECGRCWSGQTELLSRLGELFAPFASKNARCVTEEAMRPSEGLCIASLLWEDVPFRDKTPKGLCRMTVAFGHQDAPGPGLAIYAIQVTPVTRP
jgi:hypothetical protein